MKRLLVSLVVVVAFRGAAFAGVEFKPLTFAEAQAQASAEHKFVMVDVYTDWCSWCKVLDKQTYSSDSVAAYVNANFVPVKINAEKGNGIAFAIARGVTVYPTILFIDTTGAEIDCVMGYQSPEDFLASMRIIRAEKTNCKDSLKSNYAALKGNYQTVCAHGLGNLWKELVVYDSAIAAAHNTMERAQNMDLKAGIFFVQGNYQLAVSEEQLALAFIIEDNQYDWLISAIKKNLDYYKRAARL